MEKMPIWLKCLLGLTLISAGSGFALSVIQILNPKPLPYTMVLRVLPPAAPVVVVYLDQCEGAALCLEETDRKVDDVKIAENSDTGWLIRNLSIRANFSGKGGVIEGVCASKFKENIETK